MNQPQQPQIDLSNTEAVNNSEGTPLFQQGVLLRSVSKFVTGTSENGLIPIPVFFDPITRKVLEASVPRELREELKDQLI